MDTAAPSNLATAANAVATPPGASSAPDVASAAPTDAASPARPQADPVPPETISYAAYYAERWGLRELDEGQPLLQTAQVSRQQLSRGLDIHRPRKRSFALALEPEGVLEMPNWRSLFIPG
jgi:hypothetical protein